MFDKLIPFAHASSIYDIDASFFKRHGVETLFVDLDNTLDSYKALFPSKRAIDYVNYLKRQGIEPIVISNNSKDRVGEYASKLKVRFLSRAFKPFSGRLLKFIADNDIDITKTMLIGDQIMTDLLAAKRANIRIVLTEKIVKEDQLSTHLNRLVDTPIRKHLIKNNKLTDWRKV